MLDEEVIYKAMGYSFYEMLKDRNVIFEGWTDKHAFNVWIKSTKMDKEAKKKWKNLGFIHAFGAKDVSRVASHLENFNRTYFVLTDSDAPAAEQKKRFTGRGHWVTYEDLGFHNKKTIEDFINIDYIYKTIISILDREQLNVGRLITKADFNGTFNEIFTIITEKLKMDKVEAKRVERLVKNELFGNLKSAKLDLSDLISAIDIDQLMQLNSET